ncbi:hypothetical protein NY609_01025, partial [Enterobacter hormaechei]|nr:hypothetical protein [Enterobacter hormaechei]
TLFQTSLQFPQIQRFDEHFVLDILVDDGHARGLVAMNEHCGKPLNNSRLLALMGELEGRISGSIHYDNVAPCF